MIGTGVRTDANRRSNDHLLKISGRLEGLEEKFAALPEVKGLLETLREDIADWRQEFLSRSLSVGRNTFKPYLDGSVEFWSDLRSEEHTSELQSLMRISYAVFCLKQK